MAVYISSVPDTPDYAALMIEKLRYFPLEKRDYRPYTQVQFALGPDAFYARLLAFEAKPDPESRLLLVLNLGRPVVYSFLAPQGDSAGRMEDPASGENGDILACKPAFIGGEDLQGIFWGVECTFPRKGLEKALGHALKPGDSLGGNVLKICCSRTGGRNHFGSLFPSKPAYSPAECMKLGQQDLGSFQVVDY